MGMFSQIEFKKIGIVGGVAWPSTVVYYSEICRRAEELHRARELAGSPAIPEIVIESLDHSRAVSFLGKDEEESSWREFDEYHQTALKRLEISGAEIAAMASNTPHHRFETITRGVGIPVINIVEAAAKQCLLLSAHQVLILGTPITMNSLKFRKSFADHGIQTSGPGDEQVESKIAKIIGELERGCIEGAAERLARIAETAFRSQFKGQPVVCLACTELPLAFESQKTKCTFEYDGVIYINTVGAHINAIFDFAVRQAGAREFP